uniref:alpha-mannosidase n=1 Tax=Anopheles culicifacies TaxID=139723 RepID=A0A182M1X9_9DIPT
MEPWKEDTVLIRFEHLFAKDEDTQYSLPVQIDFQHLFADVNVVSVRETTLAGNQWKEDSKRMVYGLGQNQQGIMSPNVVGNQFLVELKPMEIRTYVGCPAPKEGMINVHLVPHSHDDVGWLKTVDQYYYGSRNNIQKAGVQYILDSVVHELLKDPNRRFIYVESAFFQKWYMEQTAELQQQVQMLVEEGRLEFVGGAWSMNDEAAVHYHSVVDQFTWGLRFLNDTFGECGRPRIGWQIDPFGHSREQASLFAQMGYDGLFFARLDYQDKNNRMQKKTPEMVWYTSDSLEENELFTSVLYNHYSAPPGYCFDVLCNDDPMIDDQQSTDYNIKTKIDTFITWLEKMAESYRTNNLILTMGDDFNYQNAVMNFKNMDKLIKYTNARQSEGSKINAFYSTPSCYVKAVHAANVELPTKSDDFFPYE